MADTFHFPVINLLVPKTLTLGRVRFRPKGWLLAVLEADPRADDDVPGWAELHQELKGQAAELKSSTADVEAQDEYKARDLVSDSIAALRLYQRLRYPMLNVDFQTFGLAAEMHASREAYWQTAEGVLTAASGSWHGVFGEWTFTEPDVDASKTDPAFIDLSKLLTVEPSSANELDRRLLTALRLLNRATVMLPPGLRVVQLATALEALLGDRPQGERTHRIALRAAFLTCVFDERHHGLERTCPYFGCWTIDALETGMKRAAAAGRVQFCSAYWNVRELQDVRNSVLHDAVTEIERPQDAEGQVDNVLTQLLRWRRGGPDRDTLTDLDRDIQTAAASWPN